MRMISVLLWPLIMGCAEAPVVVPPAPLPSWERRAEEVSRLPEPHLKKVWPSDSIVALEKGEQAPEPGILMSEERAEDAGRLRIDYDELLVVAQSNQRLYVLTAKIADENLKRADEEIARLNLALKAREPTWWDQNVGWVSFGLGMLAAGVFAVSTIAAVDATTTGIGK